MTTLDRVREQLHSNLLMDHISRSSSAARLNRLNAELHGRSLADSNTQALSTLAKAVAHQAQVLGYADTAAALAVAMLLGAAGAMGMRHLASGHPQRTVAAR